jgi:peptidoglycan/xylan/chitin deacetylase (PgdA/CDA1 family)
MSKKNGYLVISLDFELLWGVFDKISLEEKELYFKNTRSLISEILNLFTHYNIHATWATVGMLFNSNWEEWERNIPNVLPEYSNDALSAYKFGKRIKSKETEIFCFAKNLIRQIYNTNYQEIATHTYSHYYCLEHGQDINSFESDLKQCIKLAQEIDVDLKSLVFPRNQFNLEYLKVCYDNGIENVRTNPTNWYWRDVKNDSLVNKIFRTGDAYIGPKNKAYYIEEIKVVNGMPMSQRASRLLRPFSTNKFINNLKLHRIIQEMTYAAQQKQIYHLWWHPHNFGDNPKGNLDDLRIILEHYMFCKKTYNFSSASMSEINDIRLKLF